MNLDDSPSFAGLDPQKMLAHIDGLPAQLQSAWDLGMKLDLPQMSAVRQVVVAGLGGSAIGADLLAAYATPLARVPLFVHRDYDLPAWAAGPETLVVASSHSGNTEETLTSFTSALANHCQCLAVATGGELAQAAGRAGVPLWRFEHSGQPRAAVGFSFGLLLALLARLDLLRDPSAGLVTAVQAMKSQQTSLVAEIPAARNPAKRMAGQLVGRYTAVFGSGLLAPVARRWKGQVDEIAKAWAQFEYLPEADHNTLAGTQYPEALLPNLIALFLRCPSDHVRNRLRIDKTAKVFMLQGINTDFIDARGEGPLAHMWTTLHLGDYIAYYLAMAYGVDPTPVTALVTLKEELKAVK
jgi:glucose/mannose-6-phosphate isomerase